MGGASIIGNLALYFKSLPQDKLFAWFAILIGFFLIIIALIIW